MKIEKILLRDFRSHKEIAMIFDRFNFIIGHNAVGKSSIAMAIEVGLTGKCEMTGEGGQGADDLVRIGAREYQISISIDGDKKWGIVRLKGPKGHSLRLADGGEAPLQQVQGIILDRLGIKLDVLSACLNASRFISMKDSEQKKLLAQALAEKFPEIEPEIFRDAETVLGEPIGAIESIGDIDRLYKVFYDMRTQTNRDIKALGNIEKPEEDPDAPNPQAIKNKLDTLRRELQLLTNDRARSEERYKATAESIAENRKAAANRSAEADKRILSDDDATLLEAVVGKRDDLTKLRQRADAISKTLAEEEVKFQNKNAASKATTEERARNVAAKIQVKNKQIDNIAGIKDAECPLCLRELSVEEKAALGMKLQDEINELADEFKTIKYVEEKVPESLTKARKTFADVNAQIAEFGDISSAEDKLKAHRQAIVEASRFKVELSQFKDPEEPDFTETDKKIAELKARISKGEQIMATVAETLRQYSDYNLWAGKKEALEERLALEEKLIAFLGTDGIKKNIVGDQIGPFTERINEVLSDFGYQAFFSMEPYSFSIAESASPNITRTIRQLCDSEKFRFGVAFQVALAMATGLKFALIDRADILDMPSRNQMTKMLTESELDQAIILSTTDKGPPERLPEGVKFIQLMR